MSVNGVGGEWSMLREGVGWRAVHEFGGYVAIHTSFAESRSCAWKTSSYSKSGWTLVGGRGMGTEHGAKRRADTAIHRCDFHSKSRSRV
jgi:hypothetical protein